MKYRRVAVTGSNGQLGGALLRLLGPAGLPLDRATMPLDQPEKIDDVLERLRPDAVVNCGAYVAVDRAEDERDLCFRTNVDAPAAIAAACDRLAAPLVQISTDYVFCRSELRQPHRETDPISPDGVYARSKAAGEAAAAQARRHLIVRTCGIYGVTARPSNFVETMLRLGGEGRTLRVVDDQRCTPSYAEDVANGIAALLDAEAQGVVHVTNVGSTSWYEFAREIFRQAGMSVEVEPITSAEFGAKAPRPAYSVLSDATYRKLAGGPLPVWQDALGRYLTARKGVSASSPSTGGR